MEEETSNEEARGENVAGVDEPWIHAKSDTDPNESWIHAIQDTSPSDARRLSVLSRRRRRRRILPRLSWHLCQQCVKTVFGLVTLFTLFALNANIHQLVYCLGLSPTVNASKVVVPTAVLPSRATPRHGLEQAESCLFTRGSLTIDNCNMSRIEISVNSSTACRLEGKTRFRYWITVCSVNPDALTCPKLPLGSDECWSQSVLTLDTYMCFNHNREIQSLVLCNVPLFHEEYVDLIQFFQHTYLA